ncbi:MAG: acetylornithine deacetylase [Candidatus Puniceispirillum sp. TMED52]|nr:acetylornithine deacetylase [SAR116 cluster bacterium]OUU46265.1 MAG: acetylornithine deacetylase [Candidatus Puniceispirillum sp. TMED52]
MHRNLDHMTSILSDLIGFETISSESNQDIIAYLAERLADHDADIIIDESPCGKKANLFATLGKTDKGGIMLSGHTDVVPVADQDWSRPPFQMEMHDGLIYGRGSCDMKGFIAACMAQLDDFAAAAQHEPIHFAFTYDEETGCLGASHLIETLKQHHIAPRLAIIGEPTEMRVIEGHKGCYEYSTFIHGLAGHGSAPELGVNAAEYAVRFVSRLLELREKLKSCPPQSSPFQPPHTTINIGRIESGIAHNVIAQKAQIDWEMRPVQTSDADFVKSDLQAFCENELLPMMQKTYPEAQIWSEVIAEVAGFDIMPDNEARKLVQELTGSNTSDVVAFGTEAGVFQSLGTDCVICGPGSIEQAHKADEFVSVDQMDQCLVMLNKLTDTITNS